MPGFTLAMPQWDTAQLVAWWEQMLAWLWAASEPARQLWAEYHFAWGHAFLWVALFIGLLFLLHLLLVMYLIGVRFYLQWLDAAKRRKYALWQTLIPQYLNAELTAAQVARTISRRDHRIFSNQIRPILVDIDGSDKARLIELLDAAGTTDFLLRTLRRGSTWAKAHAATLLGLMDNQSALPELRSLLYERSDLIRFTAAEALVEIKDQASVPEILRWMVSQDGARGDMILTLLFRYGSDVAPLLLEVLRDPSYPPAIHIVCVKGLRNYNYVAAGDDLLRIAFRTTERELRLACLRTLAEFEDAVYTDLFQWLLQDSDPVARAIAARAMGHIGTETHIQALLDVLNAQDYWLLQEAVRALVQLGPAGMHALNERMRQGGLSTLAALVAEEARQDAMPEAT